MITIITQSLTATSQVLTANIEQRLCKPFCTTTALLPTVDVTYTIEETNLVGTELYVKVKAQGTIFYVTKHGCTRTVPFAEHFTTSFAGADPTSTVAIAQSAPLVKPAFLGCCNVANGVSALNILTLTFTA